MCLNIAFCENPSFWGQGNFLIDVYYTLFEINQSINQSKWPLYRSMMSKCHKTSSQEEEKNKKRHREKGKKEEEMEEESIMNQ